MAELVCDKFDHLSDRQPLVIAAVEDLPLRCLWMVDGQQHGMGEVVDIAERDQAESVVGQDDEWSAIEDPAHDAPLPRSQLARTVDVRIAEVRCGRISREQQRLGPADPIALSVLLFGGEFGLLADWHGQTRWAVDSRIKEAVVDRRPADRNQMAGAASEDLGNAAQPAIASDGDVEGAVRQSITQCPPAEGIAVNVSESCYFWHLVT